MTRYALIILLLRSVNATKHRIRIHIRGGGLTPMGAYDATAMPTPCSFSKRLMAGGLPQKHAGRLWVENLKTREFVEDLLEMLVRFIAPHENSCVFRRETGEGKAA